MILTHSRIGTCRWALVLLALVVILLRTAYRKVIGVCHDHTALDFVHIPKTGGSAIVHAGLRGLEAVWGTPLWMYCGRVDGWQEYASPAFYAMLGNNTPFSAFYNKQQQQQQQPLQLHPTIDRVWHIPPRFLVHGGRGKVRGQRTVTFCVIRDPLKRLLSQYRFAINKMALPPLSHTLSSDRSAGMRERARARAQNTTWRWSHTWSGGKALPWASTAICPMNSLEGMCGAEMMNCVIATWLRDFQQNPAVFYWHLAPQAWYADPDTALLLHGPELSADFAALTRRYGLYMQLPRPPEGAHSSSGVGGGGGSGGSGGSSSGSSRISSNNDNKSNSSSGSSGFMLRSGSTTISSDSSDSNSNGSGSSSSSSSRSSKSSSSSSSSSGNIFAASWTEMVTGPVVDMVYDHYGLERTNALFTKVCPGLRVGDLDPKLLQLVRHVWHEDFALYARLKDEKAQKKKR